MKKLKLGLIALSFLGLGYLVYGLFYQSSDIKENFHALFLKSIKDKKQLHLFTYEEKYVVDKNGNILGKDENDESFEQAEDYTFDKSKLPAIKSEIQEVLKNLDRSDRPEFRANKSKLKDLVSSIDKFLSNDLDIIKRETKIDDLEVRGKSSRRIDRKQSKVDDLVSNNEILKQQITNKLTEYYKEKNQLSLKPSKTKFVPYKIQTVTYTVGLDLDKLKFDSLPNNNQTKYVINSPEASIIDYSFEDAEYVKEKKAKVTKQSDAFEKYVKNKKISKSYKLLGNKLINDKLKFIFPYDVKDIEIKISSN